LHGVQLWVALPDLSRHVEPTWEHHPLLPAMTDGGLTATVIMGSLAGETSPGRAYSPIVGLDISLAELASGSLPLEPDFEYAALVTSGSASVDGVDLAPGLMLYLGSGRRDLVIRSDQPARLLLLGGEPFAEQIVMWWNFVARTGEEIAAARKQWMAGSEFGVVTDAGSPLAAPTLPTGTLKPGGSVRHRPRGGV
jgi:quercetin 2,3-dioxygenase